jgi:DNA topoisomerase-1
MVIRMGKWGRFAACANYPECKTIQPIKTGVACPNEGCGGDLVERTSKKGRVFYSCSNYPKCEFVSWERPAPKACPKCNNPYLLQGRKGPRPYLKCPNRDCDYFETAAAGNDEESEEVEAATE